MWQDISYRPSEWWSGWTSPKSLSIFDSSQTQAQSDWPRSFCIFVSLSFCHFVFFHFVFFIMTWPRLTFPLSSKSNMCTNFTFSLLAYFLYFQYFQLICCIVWFIYFQPIFQPLFLIFNIFSWSATLLGSFTFSLYFSLYSWFTIFSANLLHCWVPSFLCWTCIPPR